MPKIEYVRDGLNYRVIIDGEHRATFRGDFGAAWWPLYDVCNRPIKGPYFSLGCSYKKEFDATVTRALDLGVIPTSEQIAERDDRIRLIDAAPLLAALEGLLAAFASTNIDSLSHRTRTTEAIVIARAAIAAAKGKAP